jgi:hypothetical protein
MAPRINIHHSDPAMGTSIITVSTTGTGLPAMERDVQEIWGGEAAKKRKAIKKY